jgi:hypothetical protein
LEAFQKVFSNIYYYHGGTFMLNQDAIEEIEFQRQRGEHCRSRLEMLIAKASSGSADPSYFAADKIKATGSRRSLHLPRTIHPQHEQLRSVQVVIPGPQVGRCQYYLYYAPRWFTGCCSGSTIAIVSTNEKTSLGEDVTRLAVAGAHLGSVYFGLTITNQPVTAVPTGTFSKSFDGTYSL